MLKLFKFGSWPVSQRRWVIRIAVAFLLYSLVGFLVLPPLIKWQLVKQLPKSTKRVATVRQVLTNPWTLSLTIRGLKLDEPTGEPFASWEELKANFQLSSLFRWAWTFKEIHLIDFRGALVLQKDGRFNFANIFEHSEPKPTKDDGVSPVRIFLLSITNGFVSFEDLTRRKPFRTEYRPINIRLTHFTTKHGTGTPYSFRAENDTGKTLDWAGDITVAPFSSQGTIDLKNGEPHKYQPYLDDFTRAEVAEGRVDIRADYFFAAGTNGVDLVATNASVVLKGLKVNDPDVNEIILSVPELALQEIGFNLRERQFTASSLRIRDTEAVTRLNKDGSFNLARLIVPRPANTTNSTQVPSTNTSSPWIINLAGFQLTNATVKFEDRSGKTAFQTQLSPIEFTLTNFTTRAESNASYGFHVTTEASERIDGSGTASVNPIHSAGAITIAGVDVKKYAPFLEPFLRAEILSGKVDVNAFYSAARDTNSLSASASNTVVRLTDLQLKSPDTGETVISIPEFGVAGAEINLQDRSVKIAHTKTTGGSIVVRRESDGKINLLGLLQPADQPATAPDSSGTNSDTTPPPPQHTGSPWTALIDEIALENYSISFEDKKLPKPVSAKLDQLALNLKGVSSDTQKAISNTLAFRFNESAEVRAEGAVTPRPLIADVQLAITNLDLRAFQPYLEQHARLELSRGTLNLASHSRVESTGTNTTRLNFEGGLSISGFAAVDQFSQDIFQWTNLTVDGIKLNLQPDNLHIDTVRFEGLIGNLLITSNKQINFITTFEKSTNGPPIASTDAEPAKPAKSEGPAPFPITVGKFELADSAFRVKDASVQPPAEVEVQQISGTITGLSSDPKDAADVNVTGSVGDRSPMSITGRFNPLAGEPQLNLTVSNSNVQLSQFTPYMEKYTGHPLNRGRLSMALHYRIEGKQLIAENKIDLEQLTLGPRQDNPTATDLPVKLGVALLKDSQGRISLDVPVSGRLDDPQFRVGPIIMKVVVNMITKAVTSPFKLIGAAVGGGDELSFLDFQPGTADFIDGETNKIAKLIKALNGRPGLSLDITAAVDPKRDRDVLARQMVREELKAARLEELAGVNQTPPDRDAFEVEPAENLRLLRGMIAEKLGTNLSQAITEMKASMTNTASGSASGSQSSSTGPKQKWYKKLTKTVLVPFQGKDSPEAAARRQAKADAALLKENPELGALSADAMVLLLASKVEVPPDDLLQLMKDRAEAAHAALLQGGELGEDRVLLVAPKPMKEGYRGEARVELSLN